MSTISYTASHFSKEDERRELDELTDAEKEEILDDIYGRRSHNNNNNNSSSSGNVHQDVNDANFYYEHDITDELFEQLYAALENIPPERSESYWHAMIHADNIVDTESDPILFLRWADYNPERAALRLCDYWKMRVEIFGEERAYKPMTLNGAMKDVVPCMLQMPNIFRILPDDEFGRTVFCFDKTNICYKKLDDDIVVIQIIWFVFHEGMEIRQTQEKGVVLLHINQTSNWDFLSQNSIRLGLQSMACLPLHIRSRHIIISSLLETCVLPICKRFMPREVRLRQHIHNNLISRQPAILNDLENFGLRRNNLPKSIGGNYDEQPTWIDKCERILSKEQSRQKKKAT